MPSINSTLRLRVFAGPNGSGKSTIINAVKTYKVENKKVDFGIYVNADDIAQALLLNKFTFNTYEVQVTLEEFTQIAISSGLINNNFTAVTFKACFKLTNNQIILQHLGQETRERLAQIIADFLRKKLLATRKKFSFETVFSHSSKLDIMKEAAQAGYKVYLYFVSTNSPEVNKYRVEVRKAKGGHDVPPDKIVKRYYLSLDLLFEAAQIAYQAFFFDNSTDTSAQDVFEPFAHFKVVKGKKVWDKLDDSKVPDWFIKYYSNKVLNEAKKPD